MLRFDIASLSQSRGANIRETTCTGDIRRRTGWFPRSFDRFRGYSAFESDIGCRRPRMANPDLPPDFDPTDPDIYVNRLPVEELAELRRTQPIWWCEQPARFNDDIKREDIELQR